ncbi:hypothetical protein BJY04DRAFT_196351, partial [Aspergillus karnatakaensis]|uniref:F-box protein n=1 Tax=Aspergillus karnatakaensis TaxID=1810916 RepID=UPI003CCD3343
MTSRDRKRKHEDGYSDVEPKRKKLAGTCTGTETQRLDPILHMTLDSSREAKTPSRDKKRKREESHVEAAPKGRKLAGSENTTRRLDPILHLNPDVINTILDLLPLADAIKCQALSKPWKNTVQDWMTTSRARIGKQLHPYPGRSISPSIWAGLTESEIKRHG